MEALASQYPELDFSQWQNPNIYRQYGTSTYQPPKITSQQPFYVAIFSEPVTALQIFSLSGLGLIGLATVPPIRKSKRLKQALVIGVVVLCVFSVGYFTGYTVAQTGTINIEPASLSGDYSYLVETDGTYVWAKSGKTGEVVYGGQWNAGGVSGTDASTVIQSAIDALTNGGKVFVKGGEYLIKRALRPCSNLILEGEYGKTVFKMVNRMTDSLTEYAPAGQTYVKVNNPTQWLVGQEIAIGPPYDVMTITSIVGNRLNLDGALEYSHNAGSSVYSADNVIDSVGATSDINNVLLKNFVVDGNIANNPDYFGDWKNQNGMQLWRLVNSRIEGVIVQNARRIGMEITDFKGVVIDRCIAINNGWDGIDFCRSASASFPYGTMGIISNCVATGHGDVGMRVSYGCRDITVINSISYSNNGTKGSVNSNDGFTAEGLVGDQNIVFTGCLAWGNLNGWEIFVDGVLLDGIIARDNNTGIKVAPSDVTRPIIIQNSYIHDNEFNIQLKAPNVIIKNNVCHSMGRYANNQDAYANIWVANNDANNIQIIGNTFMDIGNPAGPYRGHIYSDYSVSNWIVRYNRFIDTRTSPLATYAFYLYGTITNIQIIGNEFKNLGLGAINDISKLAGTVIIRQNIGGLLGENSGTATIPSGQTSVTVAHGLAATPSKVIVTPRANIGSVWVSARNSTHITISCSTAPTADTIVDWYAQV
jgi:hypothetical protein